MTEKRPRGRQIGWRSPTAPKKTIMLRLSPHVIEAMQEAWGARGKSAKIESLIKKELKIK